MRSGETPNPRSPARASPESLSRTRLKTTAMLLLYPRLTKVSLDRSSYRVLPLLMAKTRVSTKGQIVLPKALRTAKRWLPGTELEIEERPEGVLLKPARRYVTRLEDVIGCANYKGSPKTLDEMDA